jgi:hypothetical protein
MSEQIETILNTPKPERSYNYVTCRLSYDCLISSTKSFVNNFNNLTQEEKSEFKSLNNYIKQLDKCMISLRNDVQLKTSNNRRLKKQEQQIISDSDLKPVTEVVSDLKPVTEIVSDLKLVTEVVSDLKPVTEVVENTTQKTKGKKVKKEINDQEVSPTAQLLSEVKVEVPVVLPKRSKSVTKQVNILTDKEEVENVSQEVTEKKSSSKKPTVQKK